MFKAIWSFLTFWSRLSTKYARIASNEELRERSISFGVESIASTVFGAIIIVLCAFGVSALIGDSGLGVILAVLLVVVALVSLVQLIVRGLITMIYQLKLNKKPIGIAALVIWILAVIAAIILSVIMVVKIG